MGPDLTQALFMRLKNTGIPIKVAERERGFIKALRIGRNICAMTKYSNLLPGDRYFFGFTPQDIQTNHQYSDALLLTGDGDLQRCYFIPYQILCNYITTGLPVHIPDPDYHSYKAHIFPRHGYIFCVENQNDKRPFQIENYRLENVVEHFKTMFIQS